MKTICVFSIQKHWKCRLEGNKHDPALRMRPRLSNYTIIPLGLSTVKAVISYDGLEQLPEVVMH